MKKFEVEEIWRWRNLNLKKFEVVEIWSWGYLKLKKFEVEEIWSWQILIWKIWSWRNLKLGSGSKPFWNVFMYTINLGFESKALFFVFNFAEFRASFALFWAFLGYLMVLWAYFMALWDYYSGRCQVQNQFLELTNEVNQLWFWKYCPIFFVFNSAKFGTFFALLRPFGAIFGVGVRFKNFFGTYLHRLTTFILEV